MLEGTTTTKKELLHFIGKKIIIIIINYTPAIRKKLQHQYSNKI